MTDRVGQQVIDHAFGLGSGRLDLDWPVDLDDHRHVVFLRERLYRDHGKRSDLDQIKCFDMEGELVGVEFADHKQVLDDCLDGAQIVFDRVQVSDRVWGHAVLQRFDRSPHCGQRRPSIMAERRQHELPFAFEPPTFGGSLFDLLSHRVKGVPKFAELVASINTGARRQVSFAHDLGCFRDTAQVAQQRAAQQVYEQSGKGCG